MKDPSFLNSPRRILSLSKERATVSFTDPDDKVSGFPVSEEHGTKPSEVYGFVGSISTIMTTVIYFVWAYTPEPWLRSVGITYYPSRYWALALPSYDMVNIVLAITFYIGLNFMATAPPTSFNTIYDEFSREHSLSQVSKEGDEQPIEPISDIGIHQVNSLMFNSAN
ncbi:phosphatidylinositol N-acetylglucosaminyltransferase subunit P-like [Papaver somniferum]|uniref:phosphatidylinositol N-acetylglucosaminyltransferase subunit P-like n=1 Tax=Papaver somniferum TaxID=3469 RepID=UPI000E6FC97E|nr:phosphatidylinositol N-acetylglucosaminyltransferase subunit P-like [Papaver somniferum]